MLTYVNFSLFESPAQTLVNTVNTVGVMGKGIALEFKKLYPEMFASYKKYCKAGQFDVGMLQVFRTSNKVILNFPTKKHWRNKSKVEYIEKGLRKFVDRYSDYGISSISFPQLGCGNGELDWENEVKPIMEQYLVDLPIPVYIHIYDKSRTFVPERRDPLYAREIRLTRQRPSADHVWYDLQNIIEHPSLLDMFGPPVEINEEIITFTDREGKAKRLYREDIEDVWNILRTRGTVHEYDMPSTITAMGTTEHLFELLGKLDYIVPELLNIIVDGEYTSLPGLRYAPLAVIENSKPVEVLP